MARVSRRPGIGAGTRTPPIRPAFPEIRTRWLVCAQCGTRFPYRYEGHWQAARFAWYDALCDACWATWVMAHPPAGPLPAPVPPEEGLP
jgi:hypothetical protein